MSALSLVAAQEQFTANLKVVEDAVSFAFRGRLRRQEYEEALADARAAAWSAWAGLIKIGKNPVEVGVHGIANNAIRYVRNGRKVGNRNCGRAAMDINNGKAQKKLGLTIISLDRSTGADEDSASDAWRAWLSCDNRCTPADEACFRLDFEAWLASLPARKRQMAELLAAGHGTYEVADQTQVSPGRVSQIRLELAANWQQFQAEPIALSGL